MQNTEKKIKNIFDEYQKKYYANNIEYYRERGNYNYNKRKTTDILFRLSHNIRNLIYAYIKRGGYKKLSKTQEILGCTFEEFKIHIENQFTEGMNWFNHGEWEYDHIYPVSLAESEEHLYQLNHYTNFQPLWKIDNRRKFNKLPEEILTYQEQADIIIQQI